jgi:hypothetical protein
LAIKAERLLAMKLWSILFGGWRTRQGSRNSFGYSRENPVLCYDPAGELAYLDRLLCPNGHSFSYNYLGSQRGRCPDPQKHLEPVGCIVDEYELTCTGQDEHKCRLYFDRFHLNYPEQPAPEGWSLLPEPLDSHLPQKHSSRTGPPAGRTGRRRSPCPPHCETIP